MATSAAATSAASRVSSASEGANKADACSARSTTSEAGTPRLAGRGDAVPGGTIGTERADETSAADRVPATARATRCVRDAGFGLPVTTAIRMGAALRGLRGYLIIPIDLIYKSVPGDAAAERGSGAEWDAGAQRRAGARERSGAGAGGGGAGERGGAALAA